MYIYFPISFDLTQKWRGGLNLIHGALSQLKEQGGKRVCLVYLYSDIPPQKKLEDLADKSLVFEDPRSAMDQLNTIEAQTPAGQILVSLGHSRLWATDMRRIIYIPDFQHIYLSENFSEQELADRKLLYTLETATADGLWVSSNNVLKDCKKFLYKVPSKTLVLPFPSLKSRRASSRTDQQEDKKILLTVSQNWPHKLYPWVTQVWKQLPANILSQWKLVVAGRNISQGIKGDIQSFEAMDNPDDGTLKALFEKSEAFILASRFEGWSTPVEEAIDHKLPLLLSDIGIFKEQVPQGAVFFKNDNNKSLEGALIKVLSSQDFRGNLIEKQGKLRRHSPSSYGVRLNDFFEEVSKCE